MLLELVGTTATSALDSAVQAMAGGVPLDFDRTVLLQIVVFTVLIVVLKPLLFDPVLKVFALREERTEGARPPTLEAHPAREAFDFELQFEQRPRLE